MTNVLTYCSVLLVLFWITVSVAATDGGSITLNFTQFTDHMAVSNRSGRIPYGAASTAPAKTNEFTSMRIDVARVEEGIGTICWAANITTLEDISLALDPGTYKIYTQLEGDDTVLEYNNDSAGYVITSQSNLVVLMSYSPWDEYILDAPWRIEHSEINIPILAVDTGTNWADIYNITVYDHNDGDRLVASTNWNYTQPISWGELFSYLFNVNKSSFVQVDGKVSIRIFFELHLNPDYWEGPVSVKISQYDTPKMEDWYCGDTHQHTNYTENIVEIGAPIYATKAANNALGLDWMIVTDHSFDLWQEKWDVSTTDCESHSDDLFRVLQGEEVSCYLPGTDQNPGEYQYNHLLVYGADFIPGGEWEDGTGSDYTPAEAIAIAQGQGGVTYLAHPIWGDQFRDSWRNEDYSLPFTGLQIWNYATGKSEPTHLTDGIAKWSELLLSGRHVYVEGGTDAHGDFNSIAGNVKTYVYAAGYSQDSLPPRSHILNALRNGHSVMTDGPLVIFDINGEVIGNSLNLTKGKTATLRIQWNSTPEFGYLTNITVKSGVINATNETSTTYYLDMMGTDNLSDEYEIPIAPNKSCYYRIEAVSETAGGETHACFTNPSWVAVVHDTTAPEVTITAPINGSTITASNVTVTGYATDDVGIVSACIRVTYEGGGGGGCIQPPNTSSNFSFNWTVSLAEGANTIRVRALDAANNSANVSIVVLYLPSCFDIGPSANPYPSIPGTFNGTIRPNETISVRKLYTYPCAGTSGHTEYVKLWNSTGWNVTATWNGYVGDWHNLTFNNSFTLYANETYNYTIHTGSYPQIIHAEQFTTTVGVITCTEFVDLNGKQHEGCIPAILLA